MWGLVDGWAISVSFGVVQGVCDPLRRVAIVQHPHQGIPDIQRSTELAPNPPTPRNVAQNLTVQPLSEPQQTTPLTRLPALLVAAK